MSDFVAYVESKAGSHCVVPPGGGVYSQEHGNRRTELICDDATLPAGTRVTVVLMNRPTSAEPGWYSQHGHVRLWLASPPDGKRMETEFVMGSHDGSIQAGRARRQINSQVPQPTTARAPLTALLTIHRSTSACCRGATAASRRRTPSSRSSTPARRRRASELAERQT